MYQKDYILRMIEMIGEMIAGILGLIEKKQFREAGEKLDNLYYQMLKEDSAFFKNLDENELTDILLHRHNYTNGHLEILAELFNTEAELNFAQNNMEESLAYSRKSLRLFEFIDREYKTYSTGRLDKIDSIKTRIESIRHTIQINNRIPD